MRYFRSRDVVIAALAMLTSNPTKAGKLMLRASQMPDFVDMVQDMDRQQEDVMAAVTASRTKPRAGRSALEELTAAMSVTASDVNDMDDLLSDLDYEPGDSLDELDQEEVSLDAPGATGDIDIDVVDEQGPETAASDRIVATAAERLNRAERNLRSVSRK